MRSSRGRLYYEDEVDVEYAERGDRGKARGLDVVSHCLAARRRSIRCLALAVHAKDRDFQIRP